MLHDRDYVCDGSWKETVSESGCAAFSSSVAPAAETECGRGVRGPL